MLILSATICICYNLISVKFFAGGARAQSFQYNYEAFMANYSWFIGITSLVAIALIGLGIAMLVSLVGRTVFYPVISLPIFYIIGLMAFGRITSHKMEMASAMGIGNGGLVPVMIVLVPVVIMYACGKSV